MGKPDGNRAAPGKKVSVRYIGKLQKMGTYLTQMCRTSQVIQGWDVSVNGIRVGDKRRITVPPSMGLQIW
ncbi:hypothetical protein PIB30_101040 [Stylosanthes scabra]|uniref:peptidylprolyl isomerase n=1 Tax=Stylosanthes scabra TaxID=79078 RepID=A0ABU6YV13_9FABA|nr:hypothetical protein [Stylosanthes scabra]